MSCFTTIGGEKKHKHLRLFCPCKNLSFNNGFNIFYSITLLTVFIYKIYCFASVKMNRDIILKLCFCHLHQLYLYKIHSICLCQYINGTFEQH